MNDPTGRIEMFSIEVRSGDDPIRIGPRKLSGGLEEAEHLARLASRMYQEPVRLRRTVTEEWEVNGIGGTP